MYYVQRAQVADEPGTVAFRLYDFMGRLGFRVVGNASLPVIRFTRGNAANSLVAIGPQYWGVTVDARIEATPGGGSKVDLAWTIVVLGQFRGRADMGYWRAVFRETRSALSGTPGDVAACNAAANVAIWVNVFGTLAIIAAVPAIIIYARGAFWIGLGVAALLALIASLVHFGPVKE